MCSLSIANSDLCRLLCFAFRRRKNRIYPISFRYFSGHKTDYLDEQIMSLVKQNADPHRIIQVFNASKDESTYNTKTYFIVHKSLIKIHCQSNQCYQADQIWEKMLHKPQLRHHDYYEIISIFAKHRLPFSALKIFYHMVQNNITKTPAIYCAVMSSVAQLQLSPVKRLYDANKIYNIMEKEHHNLLETSPKIANSVLRMYLKCDDLSTARYIFKTKCDKHHIVTWTVIIDGMIESGQNNEALALFEEIPKYNIKADGFMYGTISKAVRRLKSLDKANYIYDMVLNDDTIELREDITLCNALISMFGCCDAVYKSNEIWNMLIAQQADINSKTLQAIIIANYDHAEYEKVVDLYDSIKQMRNNLPAERHHMVNPQKLTCIKTLEACGKLKDAKRTKDVHLDIIKSNTQLLSRDDVQRVLINVYIECMDVNKGVDAWKETVKRHNVETFALMIKTCIDHGDNMKAFELFDEMINDHDIKPGANIVVHILKACDEAILLKHMYEYIMSIDSKLFAEPKVCNAFEIASKRYLS